jgi:hypothetical protein
MWCAHCRCDVAVDISQEAGELRCAACHELMPGGLPPSEAALLEGPGESPASQTAAFSADPLLRAPDATWAIESDLVEARWLLACTAAHEGKASPAEEDAAWMEFARNRSATASRMRPAPSTKPAARGGPTYGVLTWLVICAGAMTLAFGAGLLGCTVVYRRDDLWNWGLLTALAGQLVLFLGVVARMARWRSSTCDINEVAPSSPQPASGAEIGPCRLTPLEVLWRSVSSPSNP